MSEIVRGATHTASRPSFTVRFDDGSTLDGFNNKQYAQAAIDKLNSNLPRQTKGEEMSTNLYDVIIALANNERLGYEKNEITSLIEVAIEHERDSRKVTPPPHSNGRTARASKDDSDESEPITKADDSPAANSTGAKLGVLRKVGKDWRLNKSKIKEYVASFKKDVRLDVKTKGAQLFEQTIIHAIGEQAGLTLNEEPLNYREGLAMMFGWLRLNERKPLFEERQQLLEALVIDEAKAYFNPELFQHIWNKTNEIYKEKGYGELRDWSAPRKGYEECELARAVLNMNYGNPRPMTFMSTKTKDETSVAMSEATDVLVSLLNEIPTDTFLKMVQFAPYFMEDHQIERYFTVDEYFVTA